VLLDEADEALQDERAPTWHARELGFERARRSSARITLVTPAPTLDAEAHAGPPLRPPRPAERAGWPRLETVDPRDEPPGHALLTTRLASALHEVVDGVESGRALCVLNRKGRARLLVCDACGQLARCERCGAAVTESGDELLCLRCGATRPRICLHCHHTRFRARRPGVTRVAEEIAALVKRARVAEVVGASPDGIPDDADIVVGTEAVLHRVSSSRPVLLCAFLEFDQELLAPRYRAVDQALWLLVRAGRVVGPRSGLGRLLVQTRVPDHEVLEAVRQADPALVTPMERDRRSALGFPPFGGLAEVSGETAAVDAACRLLTAVPTLRVLGPTGAPEPRALVQAISTEALCDGLATVDFSTARAEGRLRVAVDPPRV
jgi:primosomal protein N' (replication factor Y) (superfamily II helicase)